MAAQDIPAAEFDVTADLVGRLLADQHPDLAGRPLRLVANGWDNAVFRLGDDLAVRMPRRQLGADLVEHEQRWLPGLAALLPLPIAAPLRVGLPAHGYPWRWSVCPWFDGDVAADVPLADPVAEAARLGAFVAAMHRAAPTDAPENPFRGQPVVDLRPRVLANVDRLGDLVDGPRVLAAFDRFASVDEWHDAPVWLHGDLHSGNVIVRDGRIVAVIDFGDLTSGDPAVDLAVAWMLFRGAARARFRSVAVPSGDDGSGGAADATWSRARAWALHFALLYLLHSVDARFERMGTTLLAEVLADGA